MGLGRFGGGAGAVRWLVDQGADVLVTDLADADTLAEPIASIRDLVDAGRVSLSLGGHDAEAFHTADALVVSPAVPRPWENPFIRAAVEHGVRLTTEIRLLVERLPRRDRVIGVTGTAGKSTTAAMIAHILRAIARAPRAERERGAAASADGSDARSKADSDGLVARLPALSRVWLGGNIGGSLLTRVHEMAPEDRVVLELSSAMLYWLSDWFIGRREEPGWSPHIAIVTNITPNHLDWHGDFEQYKRCKHVLSAYQRPGDSLIDDSAPEPAAAGRLVGAHNRGNAARSLAVVRSALGSSAPGAAALDGALESFTALPHRLQRVAEVEHGGGVVRAYNDSKCTTPEAAALAVMACATCTDNGGAGVLAVDGAVPVHLIAGGSDKGVDLAPMVEVAARCRGVYTIGATGPTITRLICDMGGRAEECGDLEAAVGRAAHAARPGEVILLSPGCASWDQFKNYDERGRVFTGLVRAALGLPRADDSLFAMPAAVEPAGVCPRSDPAPEHEATENHPNIA